MASRPEIPTELDSWEQRLKSDLFPVVYDELQELICSMNQKEVQDNLFKVLPLSLKLLDHHHVPNRFLGLKCVAHLTENVPLADLKRQGVDMLLLHTFKNGLYVDDDDFLEELLPSQLIFLKMFMNDSNSFTDHVDDVSDQILKNMELTTHVSRKKVHWKNLSSYLLFLDLATLKYSKRIVALLEDQLSYPLQECFREMFLNIVQTTHSFVVCAKPRIKYWQDQLLFILLKFAHSNLDFLTNDAQIVQEIISVLEMLSNCDENSFRDKIKIVMQTSNGNANVVKCLSMLKLDV